MKPIVMSGPLPNYLLLLALESYGLLYVVMSDRKIQNVEGVALLALFAGFLIQLTNIQALPFGIYPLLHFLLFRPQCGVEKQAVN